MENFKCQKTFQEKIRCIITNALHTIYSDAKFCMDLNKKSFCPHWYGYPFHCDI